MFGRVLKSDPLQRAAGLLAPGKVVRISGVWGSSAPMIAAALGRLSNAPVLYITPHPDDADDAVDDVELFTGAEPHLFPAWEVSPPSAGDQGALGGAHGSDEITSQRLRICNLLAKGRTDKGERVDFLVSPVMALLQPVPSPDTLAKLRLTLCKGGRLDLDDLSAWLLDAGYERVDPVDQPGQFARRGGIVVVCPIGAGCAVSIEFFGDEITSIRRVDLDTQRSTGEIFSYDLIGVAPVRGAGAGSTTCLPDYLPDDTIVCMVDPADLVELAEELYDRVCNELASPRSADALYRPAKIFQHARRFAVAEMLTFRPKLEDESIPLSIRSFQRVSVNTREAMGELEELSRSDEVWVFCENPAERQRFEQLLAASHPLLAGRLKMSLGHLHTGFHWPGEKLVAIGHHEIFHRYARVRRIRRVRAGRPITSLMDLRDGDYVVHVTHGIARFQGLKRLDRNGRSEEYLTLRFAGSAVVHVPVSQIDLVQKYIGSGKVRPTLSKLGGTLWSKQKARAQDAVRDLAAEMLRTQAMRAALPGEAYPADTEWQRQFTGEFLYTETEDQLIAMQQIDTDMLAGRPMDRLLCGDVGYGKTELAMRAAFKVVEASRQVAVLVPTTVLADQHLRTFRERMADYPFVIDALSRFRSPSEQRRIVEMLSEGQIDILIGTHRLLSDDVKFRDLGLIVIDEEQRFGVEHKERLKHMRATVEVLTMTATPIPRTLHMALLGLRDISALATPPLDRRAIHTELCRQDDRLIRTAILRELNRRGQVFFVHNRVMDIRSVAEHVQSLVPEARVTIAHGQMAEGELEKTMLRFVRQEIDVLVCTTIIESGLDIPTANTMIIHDADRFGLCELHQLRGRVGRYKHRAYCYLLVSENRPVAPVAARRLKAIEEFSDLGAGFQIAMRDLEIRGAGNILGREQSGHIALVGYELYCRLLEQSVRKLQGKKPIVQQNVHVELGVDACLPDGYIPSAQQRMEIYRRMARCTHVEELRQLAADMKDAYGRIPPLALSMLDLTEIRVLAWRLGIASIVLMPPDIIFTVDEFTRAAGVFEGAAGSVRLPDAGTVHWRPPREYIQPRTIVNVLLKRLRLTRQDG